MRHALSPTLQSRKVTGICQRTANDNTKVRWVSPFKYWYFRQNKIGLVFGFCGCHFIGIGLVLVCHFPENDISSATPRPPARYVAWAGELLARPTDPLEIARMAGLRLAWSHACERKTKKT